MKKHQLNQIVISSCDTSPQNRESKKKIRSRKNRKIKYLNKKNMSLK